MKLPFIHSLRFRLSFFIFLGILPPILVTTGYVSSKASQIIQQDAEAILGLKAEALAKSVSSWDELTTSALQNLSNQPDILSMDEARQRPVLIEMGRAYKHLYLIHTTDLEGINVARNDDKEPKVYSDRPWFLGAKAGNNITRQVLISRTTQEPALCMSTPVQKDALKILGVATICSDLTVLAEQVGVVRVGDTGYAFLVNETGQVVAHPLAEFSAELKDLSAYPPVESALQGNSQHLQFTDDAGIDWISYGLPLENGWSIIVQQQRTEVLLLQAAYQRLSWIIAGLLVLGVGILSWIITNQVLRPISCLTDAAVEMSEGDFTQQVKIEREDELGILARAFNSMGQQLRASFSKLEKTNEQLTQRTDDLEQTLSDLQQTQSQMLHSEKMSALGQMVAGIAHEINNPVNFIHGNLKHLKTYSQDLLGFLQLYETQYPNPDEKIQTRAEEIDIAFIKEDLDSILSSMHLGTERIKEIVLSLRNFSRMDESERKLADIHEGLESTLTILAHRLKAQPNQEAITIIRDFDNLPKVECLAGQLNQVFMNILANSIDALASEHIADPNSQKKPQITLRTEAHPKSVVISIADNGPGMPAAVKNRIFDPFFTTKCVGKGTGMGLSISYKIIVEKHKGKFECFSDEGIGTEFRIQISTGAALS